MAPNAAFDEYAQDLRSRNEAPSLELGDLRRQMAKESYFLPPSKELRVHRAAIAGTKTSCWVISLERDHDGNYIFPFGDDFDALLSSGEEEPPEPLHEPEPVQSSF